MSAAPDFPAWENSPRTLLRLPIEIRVLRGCGYCGVHLLTELEFLDWLEAPRDVTCPWCKTFTRLPADYARVRELLGSSEGQV